MCIFESVLAMPAGGDFPYPDMMPGADVEEVDQSTRSRADALAEEGCGILRAAGVQAQRRPSSRAPGRSGARSWPRRTNATRL